MELWMRVDSRICRWLASIAWMLSLGWFWLVTLGSWGFTPGALLMWTLLALPLAWLTVRWLKQRGRAPSHRLVAVAGSTWVVLCVGAILLGYFADAPFWDGIELQAFVPVLVLYALFPLIVTCMAIVLAWRNSPRLRAVE
jgi:hypothetical protein